MFHTMKHEVANYQQTQFTLIDRTTQLEIKWNFTKEHDGMPKNKLLGSAVRAAYQDR